MEGVDDKSPEALIKVFSVRIQNDIEELSSNLSTSFQCLVECFYKKNKYIGKGDTLNMKMVKMDAEHQFAERPKEKAYYIKAYDDCNKRGRNSFCYRSEDKTLPIFIVTKEFGAIKNSPAVKALFKNACRPFFTLIFLCHSDYHTKNSCPYFRWEDADNEEHCKDAREKCYEIDGLEVPERIFD